MPAFPETGISCLALLPEPVFVFRLFSLLSHLIQLYAFLSLIFCRVQIQALYKPFSEFKMHNYTDRHFIAFPARPSFDEESFPEPGKQGILLLPD